MIDNIPIESKPISGLSFKSLAALVTCTVTIVAFVLNTTGNINDRLNKIELLMIEKDKYNELRLINMEKRLNIIEGELKELRDRQNEYHGRNR